MSGEENQGMQLGDSNSNARSANFEVRDLLRDLKNRLKNKAKPHNFQKR